MTQLSHAIASGQWSEAERVAASLLEQHPDAGMLWQALATAQVQQGRDGLDAWRAAVRRLPDDAAARNNLAGACARVGQVEEAIEHWRRALVLQPTLIEAHLNLGAALHGQARTDEALSAYRHALAIDPSRIEALVGVGAISLADGRLQDAADAYGRARRLRPGSAEILVNLAAAIRGLGRLDTAIGLFRQALTISPGLAEAHAGLGTALRLQGRSEEAEACLKLAIQLKPDLISAMTAMAESRADQGDFEGAEAWFRRAMSADPDDPEAWAGIPRVRRMTDRDGDWLAGARRIVALAPPPRRLAHLRYALGKHHDDLGDYAEAFDNFEQANALSKLCRPPHDRAVLSARVDDVMRTYDADWLAAVQGGGNASSTPVFVIGMLRSGTTLLEQMLASHPNADGAGELSFWGEAAARIGVSGPPDGERLDVLASDYLSRLREAGGEASRVVDKMPANFMHLGLIHAAFPNARILHMRRDPIDTCLSIFFQHFEPTLTYANDLNDLADYYRRYEQVMAHWRRTLPDGAIMTVDYESLVSQPRPVLEGVLDFIDLPWSDDCLAFHRTRRTIITASKWQARQKISTDSVGRRRRYEPFIAPLLTLASPRRPA
jgi:tetratricopeptide (TPR) repeat protein